jgi:hypothetical protein
MKNKPSPSMLLILATLFSFLPAGCSTVMDQKVAEIEPGAPQYVVRLEGSGWSKSETKNGPITEGMTIEDVLAATRAKQKFRDMEIKIIRKVPSSGQVVKMPVVFKASDRSIKPEQNYAIHPNDQILIKQIVISPMDKFIDTLVAPMSR